MKVAVVHDWLTTNAGSESVLEEILRLFPQATLYTSVYNKKQVRGFYAVNIKTTKLQNIPILRFKHKLMSYFRAVYFEQLDLSEYDMVIVSSHAEAKGVITRPQTTTICYCHTPTRYYWSDYAEYTKFMEFGPLNPIVKLIFPKLSSYMRVWDRSAADRVNKFIANSKEVASRINKYYRKEAIVIYPPVDTDFYHVNYSVEREDFYFTAGRIVPYKKVDIIAETFAQSGKKLVIAGDGTMKKSLSKKYSKYSNIKFVGRISNEDMRTYFQKAKAFVFIAHEDFGIIPVEAQSCGCPIIAYRKGGVLESVEENKTGIFIDEQTVGSLNDGIKKFEKRQFNSSDCRSNSLRFTKDRFREEFKKFILSNYSNENRN